MSLKLFTCVLDDLFRKVNWDNRWGLRINGKILFHLRFADDIVLVASFAVSYIRRYWT